MNARCMIETKQQSELRANCLYFNKRFSKGIVGVHHIFSFFLLSVWLSSSWWLFLILSRLFLSLTLSVSLSRSLLSLPHYLLLSLTLPFFSISLLSPSVSPLSLFHYCLRPTFEIFTILKYIEVLTRIFFYKLAHCWK